MRIPIAATVLGLTTSAFAGSPATVDEVIHSSTTIADQPITLPQGPIEVSATIFTIQPGASCRFIAMRFRDMATCLPER